MLEFNSFEAIKIGLASPETILKLVARRGYRSRKLSTTARLSPKRTVFSAKRYSDLQRTGNATAVNTRR